MRLHSRTMFILAGLLMVPAYALGRLAAHVDWRILVGVPFLMSVAAFMAYRSDKRRAEAGEWRISEGSLHLMALISGWPGAFLGQRVFRHKTAKVSFQIVFWTIVLFHQLAAIDSILGWRYTKEAIRVMGVGGW